MQTSNSTMNSVQGTAQDYLRRPDINKLNENYTDGDSIDQPIFAEMRSGILLCAGDHYNQRQNRFYKRIRDAKELSDQQKLRLTKNHIQKICKLYANYIVASNPGVGFTPKDEQSNHDKKVAEMHHSVWRDAVERYHIDDKIDDWVDSFIQEGEVIVKLFYDPMAGEITGYEPLVDETTGVPLVDEFGQQLPDENSPVPRGEFVWEQVNGFNLLRPPECKDMRKAEWLCIRKMTNRQELQRKYKNDEAKLRMINSDQDETYVVFDAISGGYKKSSSQTMIREYYYRPSLLFPEGYFYITTKEGILEEGPLPGGLFPIVFAAFDKVQTSPRGRSPIKTMRPYQAEINRSASKIAEHQITLGDDKLLIQNGTKVSAGVSLPGVRSINVTGTDPKILPGRSGEQYIGYSNSQIDEMYKVMMVAELAEDQNSGNIDPYVLLFRSARQKKKFQRYIKRIEKFLVELVSLYLKLAKIHLPDESVIMAVGKNEAINIAEYRQLEDTSFEIKIEAQSEDIESKLGKQIVLNHALQYVGSKMDKDDIGKMLRNMPFANVEDDFDDLTLDYDTAMNDILALDRGEKPPINQYDTHKYMIKKLVARMRKPDFKLLSPEIQQNYAAKVKMHQEFEIRNVQAIQRAQQGFIPTDGALIPVEFYRMTPNSSGGMKSEKVKLPYMSIDWLIKQMDAQGATQEMLMQMNQGAAAQMAGMMGQQAPPTQASMPGQGAPPQALPTMAM